MFGPDSATRLILCADDHAIGPGVGRGILGLNASGANRAVETALRWLRPCSWSQADHPHKGMLMEGTMTLTIKQKPELQARRAVNILLRVDARLGNESVVHGFARVLVPASPVRNQMELCS
jgi:hypothetical protein